MTVDQARALLAKAQSKVALTEDEKSQLKTAFRLVKRHAMCNLKAPAQD